MSVQRRNPQNPAPANRTGLDRSCWTTHRLRNAPTMVGQMARAADDDIFAEIQSAVAREARRREAAAA